MADQKYFRPRNWSKYQSRSPAAKHWVKLSTGLNCDEAFLSLTERQRLVFLQLLPLIGFVGKPIPVDTRYIGKALSLDTRLVSKAIPALLSNGLMELCDRTENLHSPRGEERRKEEKRKVKKKPTPARQRGRRVAPVPPGGFDQWWGLYPRKVGQERALKAYIAALVDVGPDQLLAALKAHVAFWRAERTETQFIPHPATWLNGKRWRDDLTVVKPSSQTDLIRHISEMSNGDGRGDHGSRGSENGGALPPPPRSLEGS